MKLKIVLSVIVLINVIVDGLSQIKVVNKSDKLIELSAVRKMELVNAPSGYSQMMIKDGRFWDNVHPKITGIPDSLKDVKIHYDWVNNVQALYQGYKKGVVPKKEFEMYYNGWACDTTGCSPDYVKTYVVIATGTSAKGKRYYLYDSNNNYDLSDETPTELGDRNNYKDGNSNFLSQPHRIIYEKYINKKIQKDSTWIAFYERNERMFIRFSECTEANCNSGNDLYRIAAFPSGGTTAEYKAGTSFKVFNKDQIIQQLNKGELLKLNDSFYRIDCSIDGLKITLTKETSNLESTQVNMAPVSFNSVTLKGDSIHFPADFKGKYVLLDFWSLGCAPCIQEMRDYYIDIYKKYGGSKFEILSVADNVSSQLPDFIKKNGFNWMIVPDGKSRIIQKKYNVSYWPNLFLISPEGKIISNNKDMELRSGKFQSVLSQNIPINKQE